MQNTEGKETKTPTQYYLEAIASRGADWWAKRISTPHNFLRGYEGPQLQSLSADGHGDFLLVPEDQRIPLYRSRAK